ncbi:MAG: hypothetical protein Q9159_003676 [Coniocarpon cinnabarinum]
MYTGQTLAIIGTTLATLNAAIPHSHQHHHQHHARDAAPVAQEGSVVTVYTTVTGAQSQAAAATSASANPLVLPEGSNSPVVAAEANDVSNKQGKNYSPGNNNNNQQPADSQPSAYQPSSYQPISYSQVAPTTTSSAAATAPTGSQSSSGGSSGGDSPSAEFQGDSSNPMITILNNCKQSIYLGVGNNPTMAEIPSGSSNTSAMAGSAQAYKMGWNDGCAWEADYSAGHGNSEVEFTMHGDGTMTYDLSFEKGNPFQANGQTLQLQNTTCLPIPCGPNQFPCPNAYNSQAQDGTKGEPSLPCGSSSLHFTACTHGGGQQE